MTTSNSKTTRAIAAASATLLVVASCGFGCIYAWTQGHAHGTALGALAVCMALGLELGKPLAVAGMFSSLRAWRPTQAAALALLAAVAIAYSLTAELTLMAMTRGDLVAGRAAESEAARKAGERYARADAELKALAGARPAGEVRAEISAIDVLPGVTINGVPCGGTLNGKVTREHCPKRAALVAELARAERRAELTAELKGAEKDAAASGGSETRAADPGATALATYLAALGLAVPATLLTEWLVLVGVVALEVGSALAGLLLASVSPPRVVTRAAEDTRDADAGKAAHTLADMPADKANGSRGLPSRASGGQRLGTAGRLSRTDAGERIVDAIRERGGKLDTGATARGIAQLIGGRKTTAHVALGALLAAGVVERLADGGLMLAR